MSNVYFKFKRFTIWHDRTSMKVGTDGVLLGAWTNAGDSRQILEVGTGTGLVAVMLAQRSNALIDAVEIDTEAFLQAEENVAGSPWKERIKVINESFQDFAGATIKKYDLVVSNPPFFENSLKPPGKGRSIARHNDALDYRELIFYTAKLLLPGGRLVVIIPYSNPDGFIAEAFISELHLVRKCIVRQVISKPPSRVMMEFSFQVKHSPEITELTIRDGSGYTPEYKALTRDYYMNF